MLGKIKNIICIIILVAVIVIISYGTYYTLHNKGIREDVDVGVKSRLELVNSNKTKNSLAENYNIYLGNQKHKMKLEYNVNFLEDMASINFFVYLDGKSIFNEIVVENIAAQNIDEVFNNPNVSNNVRLTLTDIKTIVKNEKEYLVLRIGYFKEYNKSKYYVFTGEGKSLILDGLVVKDESVYYVSDNEEELGFFYNTSEQIMAKIHNEDLYALVPFLENDNLSILEYKYVINDEEIKEELVNTYNNVKIKDTTKEE